MCDGKIQKAFDVEHALCYGFHLPRIQKLLVEFTTKRDGDRLEQS
jgi:hypothetical protein